MVKKKKVVFHSDFALSKTGFGRNAKAILSYLYKTGKYDLVSLCGGITKSHPELERSPWKSYGTVPNSGPEAQDCNSNPDRGRMYGYGAFEIDKIIETEKPDVYIGVQDFWGVDYTISKPWFNKITSVIWTTLDSLPLLPNAISEAPKIKNYWIWSNFATKEMHRLGHAQVKTLHGAVEVSDFKIFSQEQKAKLRKQNNISEKDFIIGYVFRNQLRKSVPNLLQGFKIFKDSNPDCSPKLLLHTSWQEGWNIPKLCVESGVDLKDILTTYACRSCNGYEIKNFQGVEVPCSSCQIKNSSVTTGTGFGISEAQLNEVYNLMDVYCHPFTSGGQEIPIQEAKLTGLITLVTNYSCGQEMCEPEAASIPLEWSEYREFGTEFIKASTCPKSIAKSLEIVWRMDKAERERLGRQARKWTINNFSTSVIGGKIEEFLDSCEFSNYNPDDLTLPIQGNPNAIIYPLDDNVLWLKSLYSLILIRNVSDDDEGLIHWIEKLRIGVPRPDIENYFRQVATSENQKGTYKQNDKPFKIKDLFANTIPEDRIFVSIDSSPENAFLATKIIDSIKNKYPNKKIFVATNMACQPIFLANSNIEAAIIPTREFQEGDFLKSNFYESYCLDSFSIRNGHSLFIK